MDCGPQLHLAAYHAEPGLRSAIPGVGVFCRTDNALILGAGAFSNSIGSRSSYVFAGYQPWQLGTVKIGAFGGVIDGYGRGAMPWGALALSIPIYQRTELHISAIPPVKNVVPLTFALSVSYFWK